MPVLSMEMVQKYKKHWLWGSDKSVSVHGKQLNLIETIEAMDDEIIKLKEQIKKMEEV